MVLPHDRRARSELRSSSKISSKQWLNWIRMMTLIYPLISAGRPTRRKTTSSRTRRSCGTGAAAGSMLFDATESDQALLQAALERDVRAAGEYARRALAASQIPLMPRREGGQDERVVRCRTRIALARALCTTTRHVPRGSRASSAIRSLSSFSTARLAGSATRARRACWRRCWRWLRSRLVDALLERRAGRSARIGGRPSLPLARTSPT